MARSLAPRWSADELPPGRYRLEATKEIDARGDIRPLPSRAAKELTLSAGEAARVEVLRRALGGEEDSPEKLPRRRPALHPRPPPHAAQRRAARRDAGRDGFSGVAGSVFGLAAYAIASFALALKIFRWR